MKTKEFKDYQQNSVSLLMHIDEQEIILINEKIIGRVIEISAEALSQIILEKYGEEMIEKAKRFIDEELQKKINKELIQVPKNDINIIYDGTKIITEQNIRDEIQKRIKSNQMDYFDDRY